MDILSSSKPEIPGVPQKNRLDFIEALRGLAALYVVIFHLVYLPRPILTVPFWFSRIIPMGLSGVTLFFVVSAFTLTYSMRLHEKEAHPTRRFYLRRIFRIAPLFYVWMLFSWLRDNFLLRTPVTLITMLLSLSFTFDLVPGYQDGYVWASWTIGIEMLFYLLFPLIYRFINNIQKALGFFFITVIISSIYSYLLPHYLPHFLNLDPKEITPIIERSFLHHLPVFAAGMVTFFVFEKFIQNKSIARSWAFLLIAASVLGYSTLLDGLFNFLLAPLYWQAVVYSLLLLGLAIFPAGLFVNRVSLFLGKLSYSLYLNHPTLVFFLFPVYPIIYALQLPVELKLAACFVLVLILLIPISYITYRFIEKPGMQLGTKLIKMFASNPVVLLPADTEKPEQK